MGQILDMDLENRHTSLDRLRELVPMCDVIGERQNVIESMKSKEKDEDPVFDWRGEVHRFQLQATTGQFASTEIVGRQPYGIRH